MNRGDSRESIRANRFAEKPLFSSRASDPRESPRTCDSQFLTPQIGGRKTAQEKNKFLGTEVPRNFSDQCSLDFAYFLCLFSGRRSKSSQELCSWELFFLILGGFSPSDQSAIRKNGGQFWHPETIRENQARFARICESIRANRAI